MGRALGLKQCPVYIESGDVYITGEFNPTGSGEKHNGLDMVRRVNNRNTTATICALADGIIYAMRKYVKDGEKTPSGGNCVYIRHNSGIVTKYMHFKYGTVPEWVEDDVTVRKGKIIGYMGSTGNSTGAHLHLQMEDKDGNLINPEPYITGEKTLDGETVYEVHIGELKTEEQAKKIVEALKTLGTNSYIEKRG